MNIRNTIRIWILAVIILLSRHAEAQVVNIDTKKLLEDYSKQLFESNATGFMSPLVIVTNVGANDGFFNSAAVPKENKLHFNFAIRTMMAWVRDDQRSYTGLLPTDDRKGDDDQMMLFKLLLRGAVTSGELNPVKQSATVFGTNGGFFTIPKSYMKRAMPFIPDSTLDRLPDSLQLTNGTNQNFCIAAVPQLSIGTFMNTQMCLRYIPPVTFDTAVGKFSFFGIALKHGFTNWLRKVPFDASFQISYQHSTIKNTVGDTRAKLEATTDMLAANLHASRRFGWIEPYIGVSWEHLESTGSYTFTLPKVVVDQIGYDISPQVAHISLSDNAFKLTIGATAHIGPAEIFLNTGISKQIILGGGIGVNFDGPKF
jgi:hypothetical protein